MSTGRPLFGLDLYPHGAFCNLSCNCRVLLLRNLEFAHGQDIHLHQVSDISGPTIICGIASPHVLEISRQACLKDSIARGLVTFEEDVFLVLERREWNATPMKDVIKQQRGLKATSSLIAMTREIIGVRQGHRLTVMIRSGPNIGSGPG